ncbi:hypothetical protein ACFQ2B_20285 [Streptomyces stramineus]|uniref:Secreted protein n=1 Tax=Streptomyces stramineus TaxID=173861 RepID=A0ABN1A6T5_9ACTN
MSVRRHRTTAVTAAALVALAVPAVVGCDAAQKAFDCARVALQITQDVDALERDLSNADTAEKALDSLEAESRKLKAKTDDKSVQRALDHLQTAADNVSASLRDGKRPDLTPVKDAAGELTNVCKPG